jgi:hypothetical protein
MSEERRKREDEIREVVLSIGGFGGFLKKSFFSTPIFSKFNMPSVARRGLAPLIGH